MSPRLRKDDMLIDLKNAEGRITVFIDRDKVTPEHRAKVSERITHLGHLAITISDDEWPPSEPPREPANE